MRTVTLAALALLLVAGLASVPEASAWNRQTHDDINRYIAGLHDKVGYNALPGAAGSFADLYNIHVRPDNVTVATDKCRPGDPIHLGDSDDDTAGEILAKYAEYPDDYDVYLTDIPNSCVSFWDSQQFRHAYFVDPIFKSHTNPGIIGFDTVTGWGSADQMVETYYGNAMDEFRANGTESAKGWFWLALATHYVQDMGVPHHAGYYPIPTTALQGLWQKFISSDCSGIRAGHPGSGWMGGHLRFECGVWNGGSNANDQYLPQPSSIDPNAVQVALYDEPGDFARELAKKSVGMGYDLTADYVEVDTLGWVPFYDEKADLDKDTRDLLEMTEEHTLGLVNHAVAEFPHVAPPAGSGPTASGTTASIPLVNLANWAVQFIVRLLVNACATFTCASPTTVIAEKTVSLAPFETKTIQFTVSAAQAASELQFAVDAIPTSGEGCESAVVGCVVEVTEVLHDTPNYPPPVLYLGMADLAVAPAGVHVISGAPTVTVDVQNLGAQDAPAFDVRLFSRGASATSGLTLLGTQTVNQGLAAHSSTTVPITYTGSLVNAVVRVDEAGAVHESDEVGNNQADVSAMVVNSRVVVNQPFTPAGDVTVGPGGTLVLDNATLSMKAGASLFVDGGGALEAHSSSIQPVGTSNFFLKSGGRLLLDHATVKGVVGGIRLQSDATIRDSTVTSYTTYPAITAIRGVLTLERSTLDGTGTGLSISGGALVKSSHNDIRGPNARAIEVAGGQITSDGDRITAAKTGILLYAGGFASATGTTIRPQVGLPAQPTTGIEINNGGGTFTGSNVTVSDATTGLLISNGRARFTDSSVTATGRVVDASSVAQVRSTNTTLSGGASAFAGASWMREETRLKVRALSAAPDNAPLSDAYVQLKDGSGATVGYGQTDADGLIDFVVPLRTVTASGASPVGAHTLLSTYNGPTATQAVTLPAAGTVTVNPPVVKDVAVDGLRIAPGAAQDSVVAHVANRESASAPNVVLELKRDGAVLSSTNLGTLAPHAERDVTVLLPAGSGVHALVATVDPAGAIAESDEANNVASMQSWVVAGPEGCPAATAVDGEIVVKAGGRLSLNGCALRLGSATRPTAITVASGATLQVTGNARLTTGSRYTIDSQGDVVLANATVRGLAGWRAQGGAVSIADSSVLANGQALWASNGTVSIRRSTIQGANLTDGVTLQHLAAATVTDSVLEGFVGDALRLVDAPASTTLARDRFNSTVVAVEFVNSTVTLRDSVMSPSVSRPFVAIASSPRFLNVTQDAANGWIGFGSSPEIAWYATVAVKGADGQPVSGSTVTVIDRAGTTVGQWDTGADGRTPTLELKERVLTDIDGDGMPRLADESFRSEPYTLQSQGVSQVDGLQGNLVATLGQTYATALTSTTPYASPAPGGTTTMPVRVQNVGDGTDTLALSVTAPAGWTASIAPSSFTLAKQAMANATVTVHAPASNNATASFDVKAASEDGLVHGSILLSAKTGPNVVPVPLFSFAPEAAYVGENVTFTDLSTDADGWIASRTWSYGDGTPASSPAAAVTTHAFPTSGDFNVTLSVKDNAGTVKAVTKPFHVFNRPPILEKAGTSAATIVAGSPVTYSVTYRDIDGQAPAWAKVYVDGVARTMTASGPVGATTAYTLTASDLAAGAHRYRFEAQDGKGATTLYPANFDLQGPFVDSAPTLTALSVSPSSGTGATLFTFSATYRDVDDDAPESVRVTVGGRTLDMAKASGSQDYAGGVPYTASTTFNATGTFPYTVSASDGLAVASVTGSGPTVTALSGLSSPTVTPTAGPTGTTFQFRVTYTDASGAAPDSVTLVLDGQNRSMASGGTAYAQGVPFTASVGSLASGSHSYYVVAKKGATTTRLPASGTLAGPLVNNLPVAAFSLEASGTVASTFHADGTGSSDTETPAGQLETMADWGDGNRTPWTKDRLHAHQYGHPGDYTVTFRVRDGAGAVSTATRLASVASSAPTARFTVSPLAGAVEDGSGGGTLFLFRPGASGDVEDAWDTLTGRWDWEGDGTWDTSWLTITSQVGHKYTAPKTYTPILEVRDSSGLTGQATLHVKANGLRTLAFDQAAADILDFDGERHDYKLVVPANLANAVVTLDYPAVAGVNYDLYVKLGSPADPNDCNAGCHASTSTETGGTETVCGRLPAAGTYYVTVVAADQVAGKGQRYSLLARQNVLDAPTLVNCMVLG